jgi:hypothetical protein
MKSVTFWDVKLCSPVAVFRRFEHTVSTVTVLSPASKQQFDSQDGSQ